ncbi:MAG: DUF6798 domain-containing protein [Planctomycetota bacterium]
MSSTTAKSPADRFYLLQWFVHLAVIVLLAGQAVPGINESHYLPKAKSALDSSFAPGDLFLESNNSHFASTYFAGALASILPLTVVAWIGRAIAWGFLSFSWIRFAEAARLPPLLSPFALASWYLATEYGHWAGEWAIGGFEGKSLAYPCVLCALACMLKDRFSASWIWLGFAVLWHPLVGGWAGLCVALVWLACVWKAPWAAFRSEWRPLLIAAIIASVGVIPALGGIGGSEQLGNIVASQVHVYFRLSHHLCPLAFDTERHWAAAVTLAVFVVAQLSWAFVCFFRAASERKEERGGDEVGAGKFGPNDRVPQPRTGRLLLLAWCSLLFAGVGFTVDALMSVPESAAYNPLLASKILRFYWFRWADIAVPLATVTVLWQILGSLANVGAISSNREGVSFGGAALAFAMIAVMVVCTVRVWLSWDDTLPPADRMLVENLGQRREIQWPEQDSDRHRDWLAVCDWIRRETPTDSLWLTPRYQQSFKWYANRAEVVCWKDVPQDNASVLEWFTRIQILEPKRDRQGRIRF